MSPSIPKTYTMTPKVIPAAAPPLKGDLLVSSVDWSDDWPSRVEFERPVGSENPWVDVGRVEDVTSPECMVELSVEFAFVPRMIAEELEELVAVADELGVAATVVTTSTIMV